MSTVSTVSTVPESRFGTDAPAGLTSSGAVVLGPVLGQPGAVEFLLEAGPATVRLAQLGDEPVDIVLVLGAPDEVRLPTEWQRTKPAVPAPASPPPALTPEEASAILTRLTGRSDAS